MSHSWSIFSYAGITYPITSSTTTASSTITTASTTITTTITTTATTASINEELEDDGEEEDDEDEEPKGHKIENPWNRHHANNVTIEMSKNISTLDGKFINDSVTFARKITVYFIDHWMEKY